MIKCNVIVCAVLLHLCYLCLNRCGANAQSADTDTNNQKLPTVLIVTLFRNKGHVLPYFLSYLEHLDYPKDRITLWLRSDHNQDNTSDIIHTWLYKASHLYHHVDIEIEIEPKKWENETSPTQWPIERHRHIIKNKEEALKYAREIWADYVFYVDADVFLTDTQTLRYLVASGLPIVSPMLISDGLYSNFWAGMTEEFYYQRTAEYKEIYNYNKTGDFIVPMVHSVVLINLKDVRTDYVTFNDTILHQNIAKQNLPKLDANIPIDDIIIFSVSAKYFKVPMFIANTRLFGFLMVPLDQEDPIMKDLDQLTNLKLAILNDVPEGIILNDELSRFALYPKRDILTLSKIFMINLVRRPERRVKMERSFLELGMDVEVVAAVDGSELTDDLLKELGVQFLTGYADPYHNRPMTLGEIGCFLSHYRIWDSMVKENLQEVLVLEDDIRFEPYFKERAIDMLMEARDIGGWDLIYFGRKRLQNQDEKLVGDSQQLVHAGYSYWTLGYVITVEGAKKLLAAQPLKKLLPVDEFLPIMFDQHANTSWKLAFEPRNLVAWSASPLIVFPTHYTDSQEPKKEKKGNKENYNLDIASESENVSIEMETLIDDETLTNSMIIDAIADTLSLQEPGKTEL